MIFEPTEQKRLENTWNMTYSIKPGMEWTLRWVTWSSLMAEPQMYLFFENPHLRTAMLIPCDRSDQNREVLPGFVHEGFPLRQCSTVGTHPGPYCSQRSGLRWTCEIWNCDQFTLFTFQCWGETKDELSNIWTNSSHLHRGLEGVKIQWIFDFNLLAPVFSNGRFVFWEWLPCGLKLS